MLRASVFYFGGEWDEHLGLYDFAYNNSFHSTIGMPSFEALDGCNYITPVCWEEVGPRTVQWFKLLLLICFRYLNLWACGK